MRSPFKSLVLAGALTAASFAGVAQTTWNMATPYPEAEFHTQNINQFAQDVNKLTNGELVIKVHSGQSLFKHPEIPRAVRSGQVEIGETIMSNLSNQSPLFQVDSIPFLVTDYDSAWKLWQGQRPFVEKYLQDQGMRLLYAVPWPGQGFFTKKEINKLADLEGIKFRTYNSTTEQMARLMKAVPTTVEAVEIPQAFSAGIVDAMVTSAATGLRTEAWEFANYYYDIQAWLPKNMIYVNERAFKRLSPKAQQALLDAAKAAEERGWEMSKQVLNETTDALKAKMKVPEPSEELMKGLAQIGDVMTASWAEAVGPDGQKMLAPLR